MGKFLLSNNSQGGIVHTEWQKDCLIGAQLSASILCSGCITDYLEDLVVNLVSIANL